MKLIYINKVGSDWKENYVYEFIFSETLDGVDGENWDSYPASGQPSPPNIDIVSRVGVLTTELKFMLIQNSDTFSVWDAVDGIVCLGWEDILEYDEYPESRLHFHFGDDIEIVNNKLYEYDLVLKYNIDT